MFDIGWSELLVIAVVAILFVGPKDLPRMLRVAGQYAGKLRRTANDFRRQFDEAIRESELDDIRSSVQDIGNIDPMRDIKDSVDDITREADKAVTPEPAKIETAKPEAVAQPEPAETPAPESASEPHVPSAAKTGS